MRGYLLLLFAGLGTLASAEPVAVPPAEEPAPVVDAVWKKEHVNFNFFGKNTQQTIYYNCDAARTKLERLLTMAGARSDVDVHTSGCFDGASQVSQFIHAELDYHRPTLATPAGSDNGADPVLLAPSQWKPVQLKLGWTPGFDRGDCLLVEEFRRNVLPHFEVRNITGDLPCSIGSGPAPGKSSLSFEALTATPTAEKEAIAQEKEQKKQKRDNAMKSERQ